MKTFSMFLCFFVFVSVIIANASCRKIGGTLMRKDRYMYVYIYSCNSNIKILYFSCYVTSEKNKEKEKRDRWICTHTHTEAIHRFGEQKKKRFGMRYVWDWLTRRRCSFSHICVPSIPAPPFVYIQEERRYNSTPPFQTTATLIFSVWTWM